MNEYEKFKHLLEYFVAHLEFCVTDDKGSEGYNKYIKRIKHFKRAGQGHKGQEIQNQIKDWDSYLNSAICININPTVYKTGGCYLNWEGTAINVNAIWDNDTIIKLKIVKDSYPISNSKDVLIFTLKELGLFENSNPNKNLESFFDKFNLIIIEWNKNEQKKREMAKIQPYIELLEEAKNIVLTGAPGTGKTFLAKIIAKQIIGVNTDEELEKSEQFAFVQFHPSYDYTDFVEGLRPTKPDENGNIGFELKDGIFKDFCIRASKSKIIGKVDNFDEKWEELIQLVKSNFANGQFTKIGSWKYGLSTTNSLKYTSPDAPSQYTFTITKKNVYNAYQNKKARPSGAFQKDMLDVVNFMKSKLGLFDYKEGVISRKSQNNKFVFVIDEINRGEISKIFGELFFSIEPSYRGKKGAVETQYSNMQDNENEAFYVPDNVYIIGSMNDIDRSVESFDFAMRRRFIWKEITAKQSADNMNLPKEVKSKMEKLNEQISKIEGLNDSYHIGGAYFLDTNGNARQDYDMIWDLRIEPLLKEYMRGIPNGNEKIQDIKNAFSA